MPVKIEIDNICTMVMGLGFTVFSNDKQEILVMGDNTEYQLGMDVK
jgi:hypothetical protein